MTGTRGSKGLVQPLNIAPDAHAPLKASTNTLLKLPSGKRAADGHAASFTLAALVCEKAHGSCFSRHGATPASLQGRQRPTASPRSHDLDRSVSSVDLYAPLTGSDVRVAAARLAPTASTLPVGSVLGRVAPLKPFVPRVLRRSEVLADDDATRSKSNGSESTAYSSEPCPGPTEEPVPPLRPSRATRRRRRHLLALQWGQYLPDAFRRTAVREPHRERAAELEERYEWYGCIKPLGTARSIGRPRPSTQRRRGLQIVCRGRKCRRAAHLGAPSAGANGSGSVETIPRLSPPLRLSQPADRAAERPPPRQDPEPDCVSSYYAAFLSRS